MAHRLGPKCTTKCKNLHGHRYVAIATLEADTTDDMGMVLDFGDVFRVMKAFVDGSLDHACIVDVGDKDLLAAYYVQAGSGVKIQVLKSLELEAAYTVFPSGKNTGAGQTYNIGLRFLW